jgi:DMSO/TMAO reductase YedYZ molybdopterin-dependent catalytic subunit
MKLMKLRFLAVIMLCLAASLAAACMAPAEGQTPGQPPVDLSYLAGSNPANVDNSDLPITPTDQIHITGRAQEVDIAQYRLTVDGLVGNPLSLTYEDILAYPAVTEVVLLICPGYFVDNAEWSGVPLTALLAEAGVKPEASRVSFRSLDGYRVELPLADVQREGVFLAYKVNGEVLPAEHGYPLRLVLRGDYGGDWVKWVERIEVK